MRPPLLYPLFAGIENLNGIGEKTAKLVRNLAGDKIVDLLWHLPSSIIDRRYSPRLANARIGSIVTVKIRVLEHIEPKLKKLPYKIVCTDGSEEITLSFFHAYPETLKRNLPEGSERVISGKLESFNGSLQMSHPDYVGRPEEMDRIKTVEAVYPLTGGITNKMINKYIRQALARVPKMPEWLDEHYRQAEDLPAFNEALAAVHNPQSDADILPSAPARRRLAYDEMLANQLALALVREKVKKQQGREIRGNGLLRKKILERLPFELTESQEKVLKEIFADQASPYRMLRLLQGDVGSGKTIVALMSMLNAVECGTQAAIMAPTEILAKQHLETMQPLCEEIGIRAELLTGRIKGKARARILEDLEAGKIDILIGTHALFVEAVTFKAGGHRRTAPFRRPSAPGAFGQGQQTRHSGHDGDANSADAGADRLRRYGIFQNRPAAQRPQTGRYPGTADFQTAGRRRGAQTQNRTGLPRLLGLSAGGRIGKS